MIKTKHFYYIAHAENVTKCTFQQATFDAVCLLKSKELRSRGESLRLSQGFLKGLIASTIICLFFCYDKYSRHLIYTADQYTFRLHCSEIITLLISAHVFIPDVKCQRGCSTKKISWSAFCSVLACSVLSIIDSSLYFNINFNVTFRCGFLSYSRIST